MVALYKGKTAGQFSPFSLQDEAVTFQADENEQSQDFLTHSISFYREEALLLAPAPCIENNRDLFTLEQTFRRADNTCEEGQDK